MFMPTSSYLSASMDPSYVGTAGVLVVWPRSTWEKTDFSEHVKRVACAGKKYRFFLMTKSLLAQTGGTSYSYILLLDRGYHPLLMVIDGCSHAISAATRSTPRARERSATRCPKRRYPRRSSRGWKSTPDRKVLFVC